MKAYPPDLTKLLNDFKEEIFAGLNCIEIGKIDSFNKDEQSATIQIQVKRRVSETEIQDYPLLVDCPVFFLQGGGAFLEMPVSKDDYCLVLFNDRDIDTWWSSANLKEPKTLRKHSLSDGFALVGINPKSSVLSLDGDIVKMECGTFPFKLQTTSGKVEVATNGDITFNDGTESFLLGSSFETAMTTVINLLISHVHDVGGVQAGGSSVSSSVSTTLAGLTNPVTGNLSTQIKGK